jgi:lysophospholipase L1-like esterase
MLKNCSLALTCAALAPALALLALAQSTSHPRWVGTWATAPMLAEYGFDVRPFSGTTLREVVHISVGGPQVRVRFTNAYGSDPLTISDAHVAVSAGHGAIHQVTDHSVTFGGATTFSIPPGAEIFSDPVTFTVAPLSDVAVSFYLPPQVMRAETYHESAYQDNYFANGDVSTSPDLPNATKVSSWYFFDGIDVQAIEGSRAIVALGDSITDGASSTDNANHRWPDILAARLHDDPNSKTVSVLNVGIGGNRVLNEGTGPSALSRLNRDVLSQSAVRYVIVLECINDIGRLAEIEAPWDRITVQQLEFGLKQIADTAHEHGLKTVGATLTPYAGAGYYSDKGEQIREAINDWIRSSGAFDSVADFDKITRDSQNPNRLNLPYDSGDHLHPNDAGYKAMGEAIDLTVFLQ